MGDRRIREGKNKASRNEMENTQSLQDLHTRFGQSMERGKYTKFGDDGKPLKPEDAPAPSEEEYTFYKRQGRRTLFSRETDPDDEIFPDWRNPDIDQEFKVAKEKVANEVGHYEFDTLHHIFPRVYGFEWMSAQCTDRQKEMLLGILGKDLTKDLTYALSNLHSTLFIGPYRNMRKDDPGRGIDAIHYDIEGRRRIDPVSAEYQKMYDSLHFLEREGKNISALSDKDFTTTIVKPLENAEKFHIILRGCRINQNVSMWQRSDDGIWEKGPIRVSEDEWNKMQICIASYSILSLSQLRGMFPN